MYSQKNDIKFSSVRIMIKLITKDDVLRMNTVFASYIVEQQSTYAPDPDYLSEFTITHL